MTSLPKCVFETQRNSNGLPKPERARGLQDFTRFGVKPDRSLTVRRGLQKTQRDCDNHPAASKYFAAAIKSRTNANGSLPARPFNSFHDRVQPQPGCKSRYAIEERTRHGIVTVHDPDCTVALNPV